MNTTPQNTKYHNADEDGWCQNTGCDWNVWNSISKPDCPVNFDGKRAGTVQEQEEMLAKLKGVAPQNTSNSGSESNSPDFGGIKTLRRVLLEFDQSRAKTCINAVQGDIDRTEADAQLEQSLANAIAAIHRLYIKRSDVVEAINHAASSYDYEDGVGVAYDVASSIKDKLGLSGEQEDINQ